MPTDSTSPISTAPATQTTATSGPQLTKKQVKQLRGLANSLDPVLIIGKNGLTDAAAAQAEEHLDRRELIKISVLESSPATAKEMAPELARRLEAALVQVIGSRVILYRRTRRDDVTPLALVRG